MSCLCLLWVLFCAHGCSTLVYQEGEREDCTIPGKIFRHSSFSFIAKLKFLYCHRWAENTKQAWLSWMGNVLCVRGGEWERKKWYMWCYVGGGVVCQTQRAAYLYRTLNFYQERYLINERHEKGNICFRSFQVKSMVGLWGIQERSCNLCNCCCCHPPLLPPPWREKNWLFPLPILIASSFLAREKHTLALQQMYWGFASWTIMS